ncbi:hypothetical protein J2X77_001849 [Sphingobacterium sp. 2149]|uniref:Uncharacterized protein n=1 Tax=Sphingobacterium zeae TaxID=1776859 RepID=A0ABU0UAR8_9SPHI|nr:hypothetical protein [Sphingobacterium zeae]MDR6734983.1 hypothetical protein [Sphingobacterium sp. 2149]
MAVIVLLNTSNNMIYMLWGHIARCGFFPSKGPDSHQTLSLSVYLYSNFYVSYRFLFFVSSSNVFKDYWIFTVRRQFLC